MMLAQLSPGLQALGGIIDGVLILVYGYAVVAGSIALVRGQIRLRRHRRRMREQRGLPTSDDHRSQQDVPTC